MKPLLTPEELRKTLVVPCCGILCRLNEAVPHVLQYIGNAQEMTVSIMWSSRKCSARFEAPALGFNDMSECYEDELFREEPGSTTLSVVVRRLEEIVAKRILLQKHQREYLETFAINRQLPR